MKTEKHESTEPARQTPDGERQEGSVTPRPDPTQRIIESWKPSDDDDDD